MSITITTEEYEKLKFPVHLHPEEQNKLIKNSFQRLIDGMIYLNKHHRYLLSPNVLKSYGLPRYLREIGTVKIDIGRQTGKSTYIAESATENDLIICANSIMKRDKFQRTYSKVMTYDEAKYDRFGRFLSLRREPFSTVYLDDFSLYGEELGDNEKFFRKLLEQLVTNRLLTKDSTIVRLG